MFHDTRPTGSLVQREKSRSRKLKVALTPNKRLILAFHGVREKKSCWSFDFSLKFRDFSEIFDFAPSVKEFRDFTKVFLWKSLFFTGEAAK